MNYLDNLMKGFLESSGMGDFNTGMGIDKMAGIMPIAEAFMQQSQEPQQAIGGPTSGGVGHIGAGPIEMSVQGGSPAQDMQSMIGGAAGAGDLMEATSAFQNTQNLRTAGLPGIGGALINMGEMAFDKSREGDAREALKEQMNLSQAQEKALEEAEKALEEEEKLKKQDAYFQNVKQLTGNDELARKAAMLSVTDPDAAKKMLEQIGKDQLETMTAVQKDAEAMGLEPGSPEFNDYIRDVTISKANQHNYAPQLEKGYRWVKGREGLEMEPIPGGSVEREQELQKIKLRDNVVKTKFEVDAQIRNIDRALEENGVLTTGFFGSLLSKIPGTAARDMKELLMTPQAIAAFTALSDMRQASATGGALGNVSNQEIKLLYSAWGALNQEMSDEQIAVTLNEIRDRLMRSQYLLENEHAFKDLSAGEIMEKVEGHMEGRRIDEFKKSNEKAGEALEYLRQNPETIDKFEQEYKWRPRI